ncbi:MAG: DUF2062 domain-containing protein [Fuerstiella sp.]
MLRKVLNLSTHPRVLLRSVLALDDSTHAIAAGVAIGMFFGLTPTVGLQTILIVIFACLTRRLFYFNAAAAMAATYVSNPITMVPLYYFWYRLGAVFVGGHVTLKQFAGLIEFEGLSNWWQAMCAVGLEVGLPMCLGALITAPIGAALSYPACFFLLKWVRSGSQQDPPDSTTGTSTATDHRPHSETDADGQNNAQSGTDANSGTDHHSASDSDPVDARCMAV